MKKETISVSLPTPAQKIFSIEGFPVQDFPSFLQKNNKLNGFVNVNTIITPFLFLPLDKRINRIIKRSVDILFSVLVITLVLSWLCPIIALLIKLDSKGPVFFLQKRNGYNNTIFTCFKFRSMKINKEADILPSGENDRRITRFGKFLRNNFLDELPQFFNVLAGDMSVVGPRPHMLSDNVKYEGLIKHYTCRHYVQPGITGLAQVLGYLGPAVNLEKMEARIHMDIFYTRHWSARLDMIIIYRTICKILGM